MVDIFHGGLPVTAILDYWHKRVSAQNLGAFVSFVGMVREEGGISALSFDIYEPLLAKWFDGWQERARVVEPNATLFMAHSEGAVAIGESSYIAAVASPKRRAALELIDAFVEDFKKNAPIWKYDVIDDKRVFAADRSFALEGSGILAR